MIKLSSRLQAIADQILPGQSVVDIGTDHAFIPIYLFQNKLVSKIILTDSREGPLEKARVHLQNVGLSDELNDIRAGNGLSVLAPAEVNAVVIAGMGGLLIVEILAFDIEKSKTFTRLVLQPRSASSDLRRWLDLQGFSIIGEHLAKEGKRICEIITVVPITLRFEEKENFSEEIDYEIPPILMKNKDPLLYEFLNDKIVSTQKILDHLSQEKSIESTERKYSLKKRIKILNERKTML